MGVFEEYSIYYDLLYKDKDDKAEIQYVLNSLKKYSPNISSLADLGCGSGRHTEGFAKEKLKVVGVDRSPGMLEAAKIRCQSLPSAQRPDFFVSDLVHLSLDKTVDAAVALFHVVSYLNENHEVATFFKKVHALLHSDGLFLFDFWYGPAVLEQKPGVRTKQMESNLFAVSRLAEPKMHEERKVVDVNYTIQVTEKSSGDSKKIKETHSMRYFFLPEIEAFLKESGFRLLASEEWLSGAKPSSGTWSVTVVAQKI